MLTCDCDVSNVGRWERCGFRRKVSDMGVVTKMYTSEVGDYGDCCRRRWRENCGLFSWFCDGNILMRVIALVCNGYLPCKIGLDL